MSSSQVEALNMWAGAPPRNWEVLDLSSLFLDEEMPPVTHVYASDQDGYEGYVVDTRVFDHDSADDYEHFEEQEHSTHEEEVKYDVLASIAETWYAQAIKGTELEEESQDYDSDDNVARGESQVLMTPEERREKLEKLMTIWMQDQDALEASMAEIGVDRSHYWIRRRGDVVQVALKCVGGGRERKKWNKTRRKKKLPFAHKVSIPRATTVIPDKTVVDLKFRADEVLSSSSSILRRFRTNAPYDVDPNIGGNSALGYNTWTTFYAYHRVISYRVDLQVANNEAYAVNLNCIHTNVDPTSTLSYPQQALQAYGTATMIGPAVGSGSVHQYTKTLRVSEVVGDRLAVTSERFVGSTTSIPTDLTFFGFNVVDPIGAFPNGVTYKFVLNMRIEFFDRKNLDDVTLAKAPVIKKVN